MLINTILSVLLLQVGPGLVGGVINDFDDDDDGGMGSVLILTGGALTIMPICRLSCCGMASSIQWSIIIIIIIVHGSRSSSNQDSCA